MARHQAVWLNKFIPKFCPFVRMVLWLCICQWFRLTLRWQICTRSNSTLCNDSETSVKQSVIASYVIHSLLKCTTSAYAKPVVWVVSLFSFCFFACPSHLICIKCLSCICCSAIKHCHSSWHSPNNLDLLPAVRLSCVHAPIVTTIIIIIIPSSHGSDVTWQCRLCQDDSKTSVLDKTRTVYGDIHRISIPLWWRRAHADATMLSAYWKKKQKPENIRRTWWLTWYVIVPKTLSIAINCDLKGRVQN